MISAYYFFISSRSKIFFYPRRGIIAKDTYGIAIANVKFGTVEKTSRICGTR